MAKTSGVTRSGSSSNPTGVGSPQSGSTAGGGGKRTLSSLEKGDTVALVSTRYNPQLGVYVSISRGQVDRVNKASIKVGNELYDKETGRRKREDTSAYGSTEYHVYTESQLNEGLRDGKFKGIRVSSNTFNR